MSPFYDSIIIGAGISGLTLASRIRSQNKSFLILEKSAGVGGRMATRRGAHCTYDHGAQFIDLKKDEDNPWKETLKIEEQGKLWFSSSQSDYIVFPKGMTQFPKSLASTMNVKLNEKVIRIDMHDSFYVLTTEQGATYHTKELFITCPLPQSLSLLKDSQIPYPIELDEIRYASALVGLLEIQTNDKRLYSINHLQNVSDEIHAISNQWSKGVSQNLAFTVTMQPAWSEKYFAQEESETQLKILTAFQNALTPISSRDSYIISCSQLKKWRYSQPLQTHSSAFVAVTENIYLLGDAFGYGGIKGAIHSAYSVPLYE
ncbi:MAG: hypothetical protein OM95_08875 [Bdellovibrio sp. ArHS]|uniref:NAD(P)/FAD-dependent oxidoreductase n=1 Tax=Bdellovibrio sp. ArHS TaxID=1569284 RepID=UPI000582F229|nr:FAD-dependent oxidoreductase [Bdellovibrio sp. ArHS]KHD88264.1 MAG: hypothetical protein OM95_08875 [Bdellovibrio sp. ArHS]